MNLTQKQNYANIEFLTKDSSDKISQTKTRIDGIKSKIDQLDDHVKQAFSDDKMEMLNNGYTINIQNKVTKDERESGVFKSDDD